MKAIVNVNEEWGIGASGKLLCTIKEDMENFRRITTGNIVIYGLNTLKSLPNMEPLKNRINVVIARSSRDIPDVSIDAVSIYSYISNAESDLFKNGDCFIFGNNHTVLLAVPDIATALLILDSLSCNGEIYICGGEKTYKEFLLYCDECLVTRNDCKEKADAFFPNLDESDEWVLVEYPEKLKTSDDGITYGFFKYKRNME